MKRLLKSLLSIVLLVSTMVSSVGAEAAAAKIIYRSFMKDIPLTEIVIPKGAELSEIMLKIGGEVVWLDEDGVKLKSANEEIVKWTSNKSIKAKKIGRTRIAISKRNKKATCVVKVVLPYKFKVISASKVISRTSGGTFRIKNNMKKPVTFYKSGAIAAHQYEDDDGTVTTHYSATLSRDVTIAPGKVGIIKILKLSDGGGENLLLNTKYDGQKFRMNFGGSDKSSKWVSPVWEHEFGK